MARLLFFGKLADLAGGRSHEIELSEDVGSVADLIIALSAKDAALGEAVSHASVKFAVNEKIAPAATAINNTDEIAFLPPVSGG
ncbi:MAG: MoaD/ThiS family protein [Parvularculaceae bacterium]